MFKQIDKIQAQMQQKKFHNIIIVSRKKTCTLVHFVLNLLRIYFLF
jgi:hypothetical protein